MIGKGKAPTEGATGGGESGRQRGDPVRARSLARLAAVQALYQMDLAHTDLNAVIAEFLRHRLAAPGAEDDGQGDDGQADDGREAIASAKGCGAAPGGAAEGEGGTRLAAADTEFFAELLRGVVAHQRRIDPLLDAQLKEGWRLHRIDSILRAILRSAAFELLERGDVPARVVISEYIDVAHAFFEGDEPKVVNGVLDHLARRLRREEFDTPASA